MKVIILGGDGYLGWPTAMYLSRKGHEVVIYDSMIKRKWEREVSVQPLFPIYPLADRVLTWKEKLGKTIHVVEESITDKEKVDRLLSEHSPQAIIHYGEQPSAPFSMLSKRKAMETQSNNVLGTLNLLWSIKEYAPKTHLIKLGTMGEYGTPNIDIEEGYLTVSHKGREETFLYPKTAGSFYHLSKVHDSNNIFFACNTWGLKATDLNQGIVYGIDTDETVLDKKLATSFHYDAIFGTALNRFCVQAVHGFPITPYGIGLQARGFLNIKDTLKCVEIALLNPSSEGEFRVFNQFTEVFSVNTLAQKVKKAAEKLGIKARVENISNPRKEKEEHYYNPAHSNLLELGLKPVYLTVEFIEGMLAKVRENKSRINSYSIVPNVYWN